MLIRGEGCCRCGNFPPRRRTTKGGKKLGMADELELRGERETNQNVIDSCGDVGELGSSHSTAFRIGLSGEEMN